MLATAAVPQPPPVVLLADPDEDTRVMYRYWLQNCQGFLVREAATVNDAIRIARDTVPDVIATEMVFPGEDASELCRCIRQDAVTGGVRLIALTGSVMPAQVRRAYLARCDMVLAKPCLPSTLLAGILGLLPPLQSAA